MQILIYWLVFAVGLNSASPKGGYSHIIWMIAGIIPWFYISNVLMGSTVSIYAYSGILKRMSLPMSIVPVKTVIASFLSHITAMLLVIVLTLLNGAIITLSSLYLVYFMVATLFFLIGYALLMSAITVLIKDVQKLISSVVRLLFYITPVVWVQDNLPPVILNIFRLNPLQYLINGYRDSLLYPNDIVFLSFDTLYFWFVSFILFVVGCKVHLKLKRKFFDLI